MWCSPSNPMVVRMLRMSLYDITTYTFTESQDETPSTPVDKSDLQSAVNENSGLERFRLHGRELEGVC